MALNTLPLNNLLYSGILLYSGLFNSEIWTSFSLTDSKILSTWHLKCSHSIYYLFISGDTAAGNPTGMTLLYWGVREGLLALAVGDLILSGVLYLRDNLLERRIHPQWTTSSQANNIPRVVAEMIAWLCSSPIQSEPYRFVIIIAIKW